MLYKNRDKLEKMGNFIGKKFSRVPLEPNHWTFLSIMAALAAAYLISTSSFLYASIAFAAMAFLDLVDGSVARVRKASTSKGAFYDTVTDRYVEFIIILSLLFANIPRFMVGSEIWILAFLFGAMMTTYVRASARRDLGVEIKGGIMERGERLIILFVGIVSAAFFGIMYLSYFVAALAVLSNVSALQRIASALRVAG